MIASLPPRQANGSSHCVRRRVRVALSLVALAGGCTRTAAAPPRSGEPRSSEPRNSEPAPSTTVAAPVLTRLRPDSVTIQPGHVMIVVLEGDGFTASDNTVTVGPVSLVGVRAVDRGRRIELAIPDLVRSGGEAPPAPWTAGRYPVRVATKAGTSAPLYLSIRP